MKLTRSCSFALIMCCGTTALTLRAEGPNPSPATRRLDQAIDRAGTLKLPLNRVFLYHQAALLLAPHHPDEATNLLQRSLDDIDNAESTLRAQGELDKTAFRDLEFARRPVLILMIKTDTQRALDILQRPQSADTDTEFQRLVFEAVAAKDIKMVQDAALAKLDYGVTPAAVAAFDVLKRRDPPASRVLAGSIVQRLSNVNPSNDPVAVQAAFALLRVLRNDEGIFAPKIILDVTVLDDTATGSLFNFLAEAFLAAPDPEMLILGDSPQKYLLAMERYAPTRASEVKELPFAAPNARSLIFAAEAPRVPVQDPEDPSLIAEERKRQAEALVQLTAQLRDAGLQTALLRKQTANPDLSAEERDKAAFAAVDQANSVLNYARSVSPWLTPPSFDRGELRFYDFGPLTGVVTAISKLLQEYALERPQIAEQAAEKLDGAEVQTAVLLQIATRYFLTEPSR